MKSGLNCFIHSLEAGGGVRVEEVSFLKNMKHCFYVTICEWFYYKLHIQSFFLYIWTKEKNWMWEIGWKYFFSLFFLFKMMVSIQWRIKQSEYLEWRSIFMLLFQWIIIIIIQCYFRYVFQDDPHWNSDEQSLEYRTLTS